MALHYTNMTLRKNQNDTFIPYLRGQMFAVDYVEH